MGARRNKFLPEDVFDAENSERVKKWYDEFPKASAPTKHSKTPEEVEELKTKAQKGLEGETAAYGLKQTKTRKSDYTWLQTALWKGTAGDKLAAHVIIIQDSPKHNLTHINSTINLLSSVGKVSKGNQCSSVMETLKDLFVSDLLHPEHKLLKFSEQNLDEQLDPEQFKKRLTYFYFEDQLRESYLRFIDILSEISNNTIDKNKEKAIVTMNDLLMKNTQEEQKLLQLLTNKIGDPSSKVVSTVIHCLLKLLREQSPMKGVVLQEMEKILFRPNIPQRVQYYVICLLTQFVLKKNDVDVATNLIEVYLAFFKATLKKGEPQSKMLAAILTGVNRAYPYANPESVKIQDHIESVFKVVHLGSFNVSLSALSLLFQATGKDPKQSNRFYATFYKKLMDPQIATANKPAVFLNLVYRALKNDPDLWRTAAFVKRLLQVSMYFPANMTAATLYIISQVAKGKPGLKKLINKSRKPIKTEPESEVKLDETSDSVKTEEDEIKDVVEIENKNSIVLSNVTNEPIEDSIADIKDIKVEMDKDKPYDPFAWNPLYAGAYNASFMELNALASHFHPSVTVFAQNIVEGQAINYSGDPLEDLTLARFLERYVYKNPKKLNDEEKRKKMDPISKRSVYDPKGVKKVPVGCLGYINTREDAIPADERFLYTFLKRQRESMKQEEGDESDVESVNDDEFDAMLDGMASKSSNIEDMDIMSEYTDSSKRNQEQTKKKKPKDEGYEEDLDDDDMEDIDENEDMDMDFDDDASDIDFDGEGEDDIDFGDELEGILGTKATKKGKDKKKKDSDENVFMSAEKFAEMLEAQGASTMKQGSSHAFSDADGTSQKQVQWEMNRHHKLQGFQGKKRKQFKGKVTKNKRKRV